MPSPEFWVCTNEVSYGPFDEFEAEGILLDWHSLGVAAWLEPV